MRSTPCPWIDGLEADGKTRHPKGTPTIYGTNFQAVSVAQKVTNAWQCTSGAGGPDRVRLSSDAERRQPGYSNIGPVAAVVPLQDGSRLGALTRFPVTRRVLRRKSSNTASAGSRSGRQT